MIDINGKLLIKFNNKLLYIVLGFFFYYVVYEFLDYNVCMKEKVNCLYVFL